MSVPQAPEIQGVVCDDGYYYNVAAGTCLKKGGKVTLHVRAKKGIARQPCKIRPRRTKANPTPHCPRGYVGRKSKATGRTCCYPGGSKYGKRSIRGVERTIYTESKTGRRYYRKGGKKVYLRKKTKTATKSKSASAKPKSATKSSLKEMSAGTYKKRNGRVVKLYKMGANGKPYYKLRKGGKVTKVYVKK